MQLIATERIIAVRLVVEMLQLADLSPVCLVVIHNHLQIQISQIKHFKPQLTTEDAKDTEENLYSLEGTLLVDLVCIDLICLTLPNRAFESLCALCGEKIMRKWPVLFSVLRTAYPLRLQYCKSKMKRALWRAH